MNKHLLLCFLLLQLTFSQAQQGSYHSISEVTYPFHAHVIDLDDDGDQDIVTDSKPYIWENIGSEQFQPLTGEFNIGYLLEIVDINNDDQQDLVYTSYQGYTYYRMNLGNLTFSPEIQIGGSQLFIGEIANLNNDSYPDLRIYSHILSAHYYLLGSDDGYTGQPIQLPNIGNIMAFGDTDGDGDDDLIHTTGDYDSTIDSGEQIIFRINDGAGNFSGPQNGFEVLPMLPSTIPTWYGTNPTVVGFNAKDIDGDDIVELILGNAVILKATGTTMLYNEVHELTVDAMSEIVYSTIGRDFNNDGNADYISSTSIYPSIDESFHIDYSLHDNLMETNSPITESWQIQESNVICANHVTIIGTGDVNQDGFVDLITGSEGLGIQYNNGVGSFPTIDWVRVPQHLLLTNYSASNNNVCTLDYTGDGRNDIIMLGEQHAVIGYANLGNGAFEFNENILIGGTETHWIFALTTVDMNYDGTEDIALLCLDFAQSQIHMQVYHNQLNGEFDFAESFDIAGTESVSSSLGICYFNLDCVDLDNDTDEDLILEFDMGSQNEYLCMTNENGQFSLSNTINTLFTNYQLGNGCWFDVDNDGDKDLLAEHGSIFSENWTIWINDQGVFTESNSLPSNIPTIQTYSSDLNEDGLDDLVAIDGTLYFNNGDYTFDAILLDNSGATLRFVGDLNGDNHIDIYFDDRIYIGDGTGFLSLTLATLDAYNYSYWETQTGHLDEDNLIDFICTDLTGTLGCYINTLSDDSPEITSQITVHAFIDENTNGQFDPSEFPLYNIGIDINPGLTVFTNQNGATGITLQEGTYSFETLIDATYWESNLNQWTVTVDETSDATQEFWIAATPTTYLPEINLSMSMANFTCSTERHLHISLINEGNVQGTADVEVTLDPLVTYSYSYPEPDEIIGNTIYWYDEIAPIQQENQFIISIQIPDASQAGNEITIESIATLQNLNGEETATDEEQISGTITCSYDPNDITEHIGWSEQGYFIEENSLEFTIRFQNTGNGNAERVVVETELSENLDWASFHPTSASHDYDVVIEDSGLLRFTFNEIDLPYETLDEPGSHGYVSYRIGNSTAMDILNQINSTASIYFDFNPAIVTNTETNTLFDCSLMVGEIVNDENVCAGVLFMAENDVPYVASQQWYVDSELVSEEQQMSLSLTAGSYAIQHIASNPLCEVTFDSEILIQENPETPVLFVDGNQIQAEGEGEFVWYFNNEIIPGATTEAIEITESGIYGVQAVLNGCISALVSDSFQYVTIQENSSHQFQIYPNPANDFITLSLNKPTGQETLKVVNLLGEVVLQENRILNGTHTIDIHALESGSYFIEIGSERKCVLIIHN